MTLFFPTAAEDNQIMNWSSDAQTENSKTTGDRKARLPWEEKDSTCH